jgi:hypothetical protein
MNWLGRRCVHLEPRLLEVSLDPGVHPVEAEAGVQRRSEPGEFHDVLHAGSFGRVDERALRFRQPGVVSGSLNHCSDTTTGALQGRSTELPRAIEGNRRSSTAGQISGEEPIVREWPQLL